MKVTRLSALAGAAAMVVGEAAQALPTIGLVYNTTDPFLQANGLVSVVIRLEGIASGETIQGFIGTPANPWQVAFENCQEYGSTFYNLSGTYSNGSSITFDGATSFYAATFLNAPGAPPELIWDSGFLGNPATFGSPSDSDPDDDIGGFALSGDGSSDVQIAPAAWISFSPTGVDPPQSTYNFMRITFPWEVAVRVSFVLVMNTPPIEIPVNILVIGALDIGGTCCLDDGSCICVGNHTCTFWMCGEFMGDAACSQCPPPCPGDTYPAQGGDDVVNIADLLMVIEAWGLSCLVDPLACSSDVNCDHHVDIEDVLAVIAAWGHCPI